MFQTMRLIGTAQSHVAVHAAVTPLPEPVAWKPKLVAASAPRFPLYGALATWTVPVVPVFTPPHRLDIAVPLGSARVTRQPVTAAAPALTVTLATKPPDQELATLYAAVQLLPPPEGDGEGDGEGDADGDTEGDADGVGETVAVGE